MTYSSLKMQGWNGRTVSSIFKLNKAAGLIFEIGTTELTEEDLDTIQAFRLRLVTGMSDQVFHMLRYAFKNKLEVVSLYRTIHLAAALSGVEPVWYDCCKGSCVAYIGKYAGLEACPMCKEPRYFDRLATSGARRARRQFCYLPLIPRLQRLFANKKCIEELSYRHKYEEKEDVISDVFDCGQYKELRKRRVVVDGKNWIIDISAINETLHLERLLTHTFFTSAGAAVHLQHQFCSNCTTCRPKFEP